MALPLMPSPSPSPFTAPHCTALHLQVLDAPLQVHLPRSREAHLPPRGEAERHEGVGAVEQAQPAVEQRQLRGVGGLQGHAHERGGLKGGG